MCCLAENRYCGPFVFQKLLLRSGHLDWFVLESKQSLVSKFFTAV